MWGRESPSPADILAGRAMFWDSDDELSSSRSGSDREEGARRRNSLPLGPRKGVFSPSMETLDGLGDRIRALMECGWVWSEVGKETLRVLEEMETEFPGMSPPFLFIQTVAYEKNKDFFLLSIGLSRTTHENLPPR
jgi:hypothetical protein